MSIEINTGAFDDIDLDEVDLDKLTPEHYARLLRLKGMAGGGDYTKERRKWQGSQDIEEIKKEVFRTASQRQREQGGEA
jgi:hypothetical protein